MKNLYIKTLLIYLVVFLVFVLTVYVSQVIFALFVILGAVFVRHSRFFSFTRDQLTFPYLIYNFLLIFIGVYGFLYLATHI